MNRIFPGHRQNRPPSGRFTINRDSPQAKGLVAWRPMLASQGTSVTRDLVRGLVSSFSSYNDWESDNEFGIVPAFNNAMFCTLGIGGFGTWIGATTPFTITAWARANQTNARDVIIADWDASGANESIFIEFQSTGTIRASRRGTFSAITSTSSYIAYKWYHIAFVWDLTTEYLYKDAVMEVSVADAANTNAGNTTALGRGGAYADLYLTGSIADIRFYNRGLFPAEIKHQYAPETRWDLYLPAAPPRFWSIPVAAPPGGVAMPIFGNDDQLFGSIFGGAIVR